jgi:hypothetical protein
MRWVSSPAEPQAGTSLKGAASKDGAWTKTHAAGAVTRPTAHDVSDICRRCPEASPSAPGRRVIPGHGNGVSQVTGIGVRASVGGCRKPSGHHRGRGTRPQPIQGRLPHGGVSELDIQAGRPLPDGGAGRVHTAVRTATRRAEPAAAEHHRTIATLRIELAGKE